VAEVPESVRIGLASIKPTLHVRYNRKAKAITGAAVDVNGEPYVLKYEPRWELWDKSEGGREYQITTLEDPDGGFIPIGEWVIEYFQLINPANYGGDMSKMIEALVDSPNRDAQRLAEKTFEEVLDFFADFMWHEKTRESRITIPRIAGVS
jgi:hypothetical protein